ncbi:hypothetical protein CAPTEDRAFT_195438 [Capitella teleta]|uniref:Uncharacterized protein n=1 Tax=Capitella teleta TaxID=283909 RepID=R7TK05_CAPTE|nr:hypothetical protein CAPTEDRAFT_195438 [Capitella teleta]|eukprot:ELT91856.1 hypothetical protein CAPTEDRAFT_195438 [Capitella teleta]
MDSILLFNVLRCSLDHKYESLQSKFSNGTEDISDIRGWRDDMRFLYHLTRVMRFYEEKKRFPRVQLKKIPDISNTRWNSRAILALLSFILMPKTRKKLNTVGSFISNAWADHWFADQKYCINDDEELEEALQPYDSALACPRRHRSREDSIIAIPRSNQYCERAMKVMQEKHPACMKNSNVSLRIFWQ